MLKIFNHFTCKKNFRFKTHFKRTHNFQHLTGGKKNRLLQDFPAGSELIPQLATPWRPRLTEESLGGKNSLKTGFFWGGQKPKKLAFTTWGQFWVNFSIAGFCSSLYLLYPLLTYMIRKVIPWIHSWPPDTSGRLRPVFSSSSESQLSGTSVASKHLWSVLGLLFPALFSHRLDLPPGNSHHQIYKMRFGEFRTKPFKICHWHPWGGRSNWYMAAGSPWLIKSFNLGAPPPIARLPGTRAWCERGHGVTSPRSLSLWWLPGAMLCRKRGPKVIRTHKNIQKPWAQLEMFVFLSRASRDASLIQVLKLKADQKSPAVQTISKA